MGTVFPVASFTVAGMRNGVMVPTLPSVFTICWVNPATISGVYGPADPAYSPSAPG